MRLAIATIVLLSVVAASATTVEPITVEDMARAASHVVEARAVQQWSAWDENEHLIYTYTRFAVARALKGGAQAELVVRQMGGSAGGYRQHVSGVQIFRLGDESVLFLRRSVAADGSFAIVGLMQGDFRIRHAGDGEARVSNGVPDVASFDRGRTSIYTGSDMKLADLEQRVQRALGQNR